MKAKLEIRVSPGAAANAIVGWVGNRLKIRVTAAPEKGKANKAVIELLSKQLKIPANAICVAKGSASSNKTIAFDGLSCEELQQKIGSGD